MTFTTVDSLNSAYKEVLVCMIKVHNSGNKYLKAKNDLDKAVATALYKGEIVGKNETERKAAEYEKFADEHNALDILEQEYKEDQFKLSVANLTLELTRAILRLDEINHG